MGGYGSTRWERHTKKHTVDNSFKISITSIMKAIPKRALADRTNHGAQLVWYRGARREGDIYFYLIWKDDNPRLYLQYSVNKQPTQYPVKLETTECNFGGRRYWFTCPACDNRVGCLYLSPTATRFYCRKCHDLTYESAQTAHDSDRGTLAGLGRAVDLLLRAEKLEKRMDKHRTGSKAWLRVYRRYDALLDIVATRRGLT